MSDPMVEFEKVLTDIVYINLPTPEEPKPGMSGSELFNGFIGEFARARTPEVRKFVEAACTKWNVHFRQKNQSQKQKGAG
ncbi:MAG: hypothetical protein ABIH70_02930 [Chloroflexota bacterium]